MGKKSPDLHGPSNALETDAASLGLAIPRL